MECNLKVQHKYKGEFYTSNAINTVDMEKVSFWKYSPLFHIEISSMASHFLCFHYLIRVDIL
jgi:hypothetical protein